MSLVDLALASAVSLSRPFIQSIDEVEFEGIQNQLSAVTDQDHGEIRIVAGRNTQGTLTVLLNTMCGKMLAITSAS